MNITRGKIATAQKVVIYGPEGIGKSTFASRFPEPLFIDTEGSTNHMDVARMDKPSSWTMLNDEVKYIRDTPGICKTLVIDTVDWAEQQCIEHICATHQKNGIEDFGYGNGYVYTKEELGRFLNLLSDVVDRGINVVLTAHAQIRKFEQPDELGAYDRYELKLGKKTSSQTSPLVKEWADMVLFANYKTFSVSADKEGKKHKAQGGSRVMYTAHHPCWDAKNRHGFQEQLPFDYREIAHVFENEVKPKTVNEEDKKQENFSSMAIPDFMEQETMDIGTKPDDNQKSVTSANRPGQTQPMNNKGPETASFTSTSSPDKIPKALQDLMIANNVDEWDIQWAVGERGYFPKDTPIENYPRDFIDGVLVGAWSKVYSMIKQHKKELEDILPFKEGDK